VWYGLTSEDGSSVRDRLTELDFRSDEITSSAGTALNRSVEAALLSLRGSRAERGGDGTDASLTGDCEMNELLLLSATVVHALSRSALSSWRDRLSSSSTISGCCCCFDS